MKKRVLAMMLAAALVLGGLQAPAHVHAEEENVHAEETTEEVTEETEEVVAEDEAVEEEVVVEEEPVAETFALERAATDALSVALANGEKEIVLPAGETVLESDVTIPADVTVVIPYAETLVEDNDGDINPHNDLVSGTSGMYSQLTLKDGVTLTVEGKLVVSAVTGQSGTATQNIVTGAYSQIVTEGDSQIVVTGSNAKLDNYGYIKGTGSLEAKNGASVSDLYTVLRFRGGTHIMRIALNDSSLTEEGSSVFPFNEAGTGNIQIKSTYNVGTTMYGNARIYAAGEYTDKAFELIGSNGLYVPDANGSVVKEVVPTTNPKTQLNHETIRFTNGGALANAELSVVAMGYAANLATENYVYPISANTTIVVEGKGAFTVNYGFKFLPGSELIIEEGASLSLNAEPTNGKSVFTMGLTSSGFGLVCNGKETTGFLVFYDADSMLKAEASYGSATYKYLAGSENQEAAKLIVRGTVIVEETGMLAASSIETDGKGVVIVPCETKESTWTTYESSQHQAAKYAPVTIKSDWDKLINEGVNIQKAHENLVTVSGKEATCTETGLTDGKKCEACGEVTVKQEVIPAKGHDIVTDKAVAATCEKTGLTEGSHCSRCDDATVEQEVVSKLPHNWEVIGKVNPTCTTPGYEAGQKCKECETVEGTNKIPALGHIEVRDKAVEATCTATGLTEGSHCSRCEEVLEAQEVVPAKGHDIVTDKAVEATCTETGLTEGSHCSRCEDATVEQEVVSAKGHDIVTDAAVEATCTETGLTEGSHCDRCEKVFVEQEEVAALGHEEIEIEGKEATCTESGLTVGKFCTVCETMTVKQEVINATGHSGEWIVEKEATETEDGLKTRECEVCGEKEEEVIKFKPVVSGDTNNTEKEDSSNGAVKTGDESNVTMLLGVCALALGVILYLKRRRAEMA